MKAVIILLTSLIFTIIVMRGSTNTKHEKGK